MLNRGIVFHPDRCPIMCLKPKPLPPIPEETRRVALQIYPSGHLLRRLGEEYADVLRDEDFSDLYSSTGQPALSPALLALVTVLQAMEHCSDRLAAEMVRSRIDWKYALHLPLEYPGFDPSVLCEFRQRLVRHQAQRRVFDAFLQRLKDRGFLSGRALQRTDSLAIVAAVRELSRLELVMETLRLALEAIAARDSLWLQRHVPVDWFSTYGAWTQGERLVRESGPRAVTEIRRLLLRTEEDGITLLNALDSPDAVVLRELPAVGVLRSVWSQQYEAEENKKSKSERERRARGHIVVTPHDPQARRATKGTQAWIGYKLHLTETAAQDAPMLITDLEVGAAAAYDCHAVAPIQQRLKARDLLPGTHLADASYVNGPTIHHSRKLQVELLGPVPADTFGASRKEKILPAEAFQVNVESGQAICPGGHSNRRSSRACAGLCITAAAERIRISLR